MEPNYIVPVGICACTDLYHGDLEGHEIIVPELTGHRYFGWHYFVPLETPLRFRIREVRIPEHYQQETLDETRCGFFLDVHTNHVLLMDQRWDVYLYMEAPIPEDPASPEKCYVSACDEAEMHWGGYSAPPVHEITHGIGNLIRRMDKQGLEQWLEALSLKAESA